jgi:iron complex transport system substrate-binding protein
MVAEYLEESPLGKAEWIKFFGTLFQKENEAQLYFEQVENEYHRLKKLAAEASENQKFWLVPHTKIPGGFPAETLIWPI